MTAETLSFLDFVEKELDKERVSADIRLTKFIWDEDLKQNVDGKWDADNKVLSVAFGHTGSQGLKILIHEFSHFWQWKENTRIWKEYRFDKDMWEWISGKDISQKKLSGTINKNRNMELECEKTAINFIKVWDLPINVDDYIRSAAARVYFYNVLKKERKWYTLGKEPYNNEEIKALMPSTLDIDFSKTPKKVINLMRKYCYD